jgi:phosphate starvation-inducible PhoH-like protein
VTSPSPTQVKVLVPGNHHMVELLGQRDELLRLIESAFPVAIHVRGNEITVSGDEVDAERVSRLFEELVLLLERGHRPIPKASAGRSR